MPQKIIFKRGPIANLPALDEGEPGFTTDTKQLFIGSDEGNIEIASKAAVDDVVTAVNDSIDTVTEANTSNTAAITSIKNNRYKASSMLPLAKDIYTTNPSTGLHFWGDSIMYGVDSADVWNLGPLKSRSFANIFGYGLQRALHFAKDIRTVATFTGGGAYTTLDISGLADFPGIQAISPVGLNVLSVNNGAEAVTIELPKSGECSIFTVLTANSGIIKCAISINGAAFVYPTAQDLTIEGAADPATIPVATAIKQIKELKLKYPKNKRVRVQMWTEEAGKSLYLLPNVVRLGNTLIINANGNNTTFNAYEMIGTKKCIGLAENEFSTASISYVSEPGVIAANVKFIMRDGTIVSPSAIAGVDYFDSRSGGTIDTINQTDAAITQWQTRSYFMANKTRLSDQGIIGLVAYEGANGIGVQNIAFTGIVNNASVSGITSLTFNAQQMPNVAPYVEPGDFVFINLGFNDWMAQNSPEDVKTALKAIVAAAKNRGGNVVLTIGSVFDSGTLSQTPSCELHDPGELR
jgi:hypothetical protein